MVMFDVFRTELIQIKRVSNRYFCTKISNNHNHHIEVPRGHSTPIARALEKSVSKLMLDSDK